MQHITAFLVLLWLLGSVWAQGPVPLIRYYLNETSPQALCNDGTSAVAYFRAGSGSGANSWVIRLQGGGWCWDESSCEERAKYSPYWVSSKLCPPTLLDNQTISGVGHEGILSSEQTYNPYFYNWNHVWLWYCSSDSHIGNISTSPLNGWHFQGKNIVHTTLILLQKSMSLAAATNVLLTGDSAGGVATINNMDYVGQIIKSFNPSVNYRAFVDCGWFLDIPAFGNSAFSFREVAQNLFNNWHVVYDESCVEFYSHGNEWHCFHAQYAWPHLETLAFYQEFQFDSANLGFDDAGYPFNSSTEQFAMNFQEAMLQQQAKIPYLFSPNCYRHEVIDSSLYTSVHIGNVSIADAVGQWFSSPSPPPISRTVDACQGYNCNPTCPGL